MNCTIQLIDKTSAQFSDSLTAVNFVFFRRSHWVFYGYFQPRERASVWVSECLHKIAPLMDWPAISVLLKNDKNRSSLGPQGYKQITLFKCLLIGQLHNLSDPKLEQSLRVRVDFILFSGLNLQGFIYVVACLMRPRIVDFATRWLRRALTMRCLPRSAVREKIMGWRWKRHLLPLLTRPWPKAQSIRTLM